MSVDGQTSSLLDPSAQPSQDWALHPHLLASSYGTFARRHTIKTDYEENPLWVPKLRGLANPELTPSRMGPVLLGSNPTRDHRSQQGGEVVPTAPHHAMEVTLDSTLLLVHHG